MNHTIQLTAEQFEALQSGQPITIEPPKPAIIKWEPKPGRFTADIPAVKSYESTSTKEYQLAGMEYQTESQADSAAKQLRAYARQLAWLAENDDGWVADWSDNRENKYYVTYSHEKAKFETTFCYQSDHLSTIFMSEANATKLAQLMNDGIVEF